jgi:predicted phosphodiesterase
MLVRSTAAITVLFPLLLSAAAVSAGADFQETFKDIDRWEVRDHARLPAGQKSYWKVTDSRLLNAARVSITAEDRKKLGALFASDIVTRDSFGDGAFRFQVETKEFAVNYGVLFRYRDEANYCRLDFNSSCTDYLRVKDGACSRIRLPDNWCYVPGGTPTWVDISFHGTEIKAAVNGVERLSFKEEGLAAGGRVGFFAAGPGAQFLSAAFYNGPAPAVDAKQVCLKKPYVYWCTGGEARVAWETGLPGKENAVKFSAEGAGEKEAAAGTNVLVHTAVLKDLKPGAAYAFKCFTDGELMGEGSFRADPGHGQSFRLGLIGDNRTRPENFSKLNRLMMEHKPDIVLNVGDLVESGPRSDWDGEFFAPNQVVASRAPYLVSIGNHETNSKYFSYYLPYPGTDNKRGHYFAARYGCMAVLAFDDYHRTDEQFQWVEKALASPMFRDADWRVVFCHQPAYSVGWKDYEGDTWKRGDKFLGLLAKYKVDFFLNGHTHSYERGLFNGTYHVLSGGGGAGEEDFGRTWDDVHMFKLTLQYCIFEVTPRRVEMICKEIDGSTLDRLVVEKGKSGVLDAAPTLVSKPPDKAAGAKLSFSVQTPALGEKKLRYMVGYDRSVDTYKWTAPAAGKETVTLDATPARAGKYTFRIIGMDEDGRVTKPVTCEIDCQLPPKAPGKKSGSDLK